MILDDFGQLGVDLEQLIEVLSVDLSASTIVGGYNKITVADLLHL